MPAEVRFLNDPFASSPPLLVSGEVHLWHCSLDQVPRAKTGLTDDEQVRAAKLKRTEIRSQFIAARTTLRHLLGRYLNLPPREVPIVYLDGGKPVLAGSLAELHFNVSHSEGRAWFAFTHVGRVGIDLEQIREVPNLEGLVERFFAPREIERFHQLLPELRQRAFFRAWTCKEAVLKAIGRGVQSLDCCEVAFEPETLASLIRLQDDTSPSARWTLHEWEPEAGFLAALAVETA